MVQRHHLSVSGRGYGCDNAAAQITHRNSYASRIDSRLTIIHGEALPADLVPAPAASALRSVMVWG